MKPRVFDLSKKDFTNELLEQVQKQGIQIPLSRFVLPANPNASLN